MSFLLKIRVERFYDTQVRNYTMASYSNESVSFKWEWPILQPSSLCYPSFLVEGKWQARSSHLYETFSLRLVTTLQIELILMKLSSKFKSELIWWGLLCWQWTKNIELEAPGIDPGTSRMLSERSTIWATPPSSYDFFTIKSFYCQDCLPPYSCHPL